MRVWIDQDLCTGDGLCLDHCPDVFVQLEDGIAYVAEERLVLNDPGGSRQPGVGAAAQRAGRRSTPPRLPRRVHLHRGRRAGVSRCLAKKPAQDWPVGRRNAVV